MIWNPGWILVWAEMGKIFVHLQNYCVHGDKNEPSLLLLVTSILLANLEEKNMFLKNFAVFVNNINSVLTQRQLWAMSSI